MTIEQYTAFLELVPDIERVLSSKGIDVPRPQFDGAPSSKEDDEAGDEEGEEDDDEAGENGEAKPSKKHKVALDRFKMKKNHEATSDEDED